MSCTYSLLLLLSCRCYCCRLCRCQRPLCPRRRRLRRCCPSPSPPRPRCAPVIASHGALARPPPQPPGPFAARATARGPRLRSAFARAMGSSAGVAAGAQQGSAGAGAEDTRGVAGGGRHGRVRARVHGALAVHGVGPAPRRLRHSYPHRVCMRMPQTSLMLEATSTTPRALGTSAVPDLGTFVSRLGISKHGHALGQRRRALPEAVDLRFLRQTESSRLGSGAMSKCQNNKMVSKWWGALNLAGIGLAEPRCGRIWVTPAGPGRPETSNVGSAASTRVCR